MELQDLLDALNTGETITGGSPLHEVMHRTASRQGRASER